MPTTYAHDLFGKMVYRQLPAPLQQLIRENGELFRIGVHGPDILFYFMVTPNPVTAKGVSMHRQKAAGFFEAGMKQVRETDSHALFAYMMGFGCHYLLDSVCHPYVNQVDDSGALRHSTLETEFDRYLMEKTGKNPYAYYPSCGVVPDIRYAKVIHQAIPQVSSSNICISMKMMKYFTNLMVCDDKGMRRKWIGRILRLGGKNFQEDMLGHFMTPAPVKESQIPVRHLEEYFRKALLAAPKDLMELYSLALMPGSLSERWDKTYNG